MKEYRPRIKTLEKVLGYLDRHLHLPLSTDDMLYARYKIQNEIFYRRVEEMRLRLWEEWNEKYTIRFINGNYHKGQIIRKEEV